MKYTWDIEAATAKVGPFLPYQSTPGYCLTCERSLWSCWNHVCSNPDHEVEVDNAPEKV